MGPFFNSRSENEDMCGSHGRIDVSERTACPMNFFLAAPLFEVMQD